MDGFYEEDDRILGHASDPYHRIDIRRTSRHLVVRAGDRVVAETALRSCCTSRASRRAGTCPAPTSPPTALTAVELQTFCPYKGIASYYDIGDARHAAWSYRAPFDDMAAIAELCPSSPSDVPVRVNLHPVVELERELPREAPDDLRPTSVISGSQSGLSPLVICPVCMTGSIGLAPVTEQDRFVPELQRFCDVSTQSCAASRSPR